MHSKVGRDAELCAQHIEGREAGRANVVVTDHAAIL